jgi:hypothetical protein
VGNRANFTDPQAGPPGEPSRASQLNGPADGSIFNLLPNGPVIDR